MPGLVPGIHVLLAPSKKDVDGRDEPGHDDSFSSQAPRSTALRSVSKAAGVVISLAGRRRSKSLAGARYECVSFAIVSRKISNK
jgi:hypothetical protein